MEKPPLAERLLDGHIGGMREPFFGPNAIPFVLQFAFAIAFAFLVAAPVATYLADNLLCKPMGICSQEARERLNL